ALADVNNDNKSDIVFANLIRSSRPSSRSTVSILLNAGNGTFSSQTNYSVSGYPSAIAVADVNSDNKHDIIFVNSDRESDNFLEKRNLNFISVLLNKGNGTFFSQTDYKLRLSRISVAVVVADVNSDNKPDIVTANAIFSGVSVFLNTGNGTFSSETDYSAGPHPVSVAVADVNSDNKPDIVTANGRSNSVSVLLNIGNGTFSLQTTYAVGSNPYSVAVANVNCDNKPDIVAANANSSSISVLLNTGNGTFSPQTTYLVSENPHSVAVADVNSDKKSDIVVANTNGNTVSVLLQS
ncbi:unnamed protein product, partial [Adineta steineri]